MVDVQAVRTSIGLSDRSGTGAANNAVISAYIAISRKTGKTITAVGVGNTNPARGGVSSACLIGLVVMMLLRCDVRLWLPVRATPGRM